MPSAHEVSPGRGGQRAARPPSLWRSADYASWWTGNALPALGTSTSVSAIAYPLLILYSGWPVATAGVISAASLLGAPITSLWGGAPADRVSRKAILVCGPLVQGAALAAVAVAVSRGAATIGFLVIAALVSGLASGLSAGAATPALRRVVPKSRSPRPPAT